MPTTGWQNIIPSTPAPTPGRSEVTGTGDTSGGLQGYASSIWGLPPESITKVKSHICIFPVELSLPLTPRVWRKFPFEQSGPLLEGRTHISSTRKNIARTRHRALRQKLSTHPPGRVAAVPCTLTSKGSQAPRPALGQAAPRP